MSDATTPAPETASAAAPPRPKTPGERLHKFLASTGAGSRRECETFVEQGRVSVNGKVVTKMGVKVDPATDVVLLDGERVAPEDKVYYLLHKPSGTISTSKEEKGRPRVIDLVRDEAHRVYTVGRLDADSTGLILVTNDGEISNVVCHPRYRIPKTYQVVVRGEVTRDAVGKIESGVWLAEGKSSPARVRPVARNPRRNETLVEITLYEGRNREVRRMFARVGLDVRRLTRTKLGPLELGSMPVGHYARLEPKDLQFVREAQALYLANKAAWDAEIPAKPPKVRPPFRRGGKGTKGAKKGRPGRGGGFGGRPRGGGGRPFPPREGGRFGGPPRRPYYGGPGGPRGPEGPRGPGGFGPREGGFSGPRRDDD